jgi:hypothetical protein
MRSIALVMNCHGSLFMVEYLWLMDLWGYEFMISLALIDRCEMLFGAMVDVVNG